MTASRVCQDSLPDSIEPAVNAQIADLVGGGCAKNPTADSSEANKPTTKIQTTVVAESTRDKKPLKAPSKRNRVLGACVNCHHAKAACSATLPCARCVKRGLECTRLAHRKRGPKTNRKKSKLLKLSRNLVVKPPSPPLDKSHAATVANNDQFRAASSLQMNCNLKNPQVPNCSIPVQALLSQQPQYAQVMRSSRILLERQQQQIASHLLADLVAKDALLRDSVIKLWCHQQFQERAATLKDISPQNLSSAELALLAGLLQARLKSKFSCRNIFSANYSRSSRRIVLDLLSPPVFTFPPTFDAPPCGVGEGMTERRLSPQPSYNPNNQCGPASQILLPAPRDFIQTSPQNSAVATKKKAAELHIYVNERILHESEKKVVQTASALPSDRTITMSCSANTVISNFVKRSLSNDAVVRSSAPVLLIQEIQGLSPGDRENVEQWLNAKCSLAKESGNKRQRGEEVMKVEGTLFPLHKRNATVALASCLQTSNNGNLEGE